MSISTFRAVLRAEPSQQLVIFKNQVIKKVEHGVIVETGVIALSPPVLAVRESYQSCRLKRH